MAGSVTDLIIRMLVDDSDLDKVDRSKAHFESWNQGLDVAAQGSAVALTAISAAAVGAGIAAADLESSTDQLAGSLGATEAQAAVMADAVQGAYEDAFGGSLEEVQAATAGVVTSIAGMREASVDELEGITEKVLTLSSGFEIESDRISQVVGQMLSTGIASSAEEGLDLLTATLQRVPAAVREDVLDAVDEYGPFFQQVGLSGEEAMSMLVRASEKGMYGIDKTGDAVKEFSIRATDMSTTSKAAYDALGLSQEEYTNMLLAGGEQASDAFNTIVLGLQRIQDPAAQSQAALALFGTPLEDLGTSEIPAFLAGLQATGDALGDTAGAADKMADTMSGNVANKWTQVQRSFQMTVAEIGQSLLPMIDNVMDAGKGFADWASQNQGAIQVIAGVVAVLASGVIVMSTAMKVFAAVQVIQTAAQWANNAAWLASPVTWIILAIIVAIGLLVAAAIWLFQNWDNVTKFIGEAWANVSAWFMRVGANIASWWTGFWGAIGSFVSNAWNNWIVAPIRNAWNWITSAIQFGLALIQNIWNATWTGLGGIVRGIWNGIIGWIEGGVNSAISLLNGLITAANFIPGVHIDVIPRVRIPRLATGGVTTGPMLAMIGDNPGGREYVEPVDHVAARLERVAIAAARGSGGNAPSGPMRIHPDDLAALGSMIYTLIMKGSQKTLNDAIGV